jgi:hypothetical protein
MAINRTLKFYGFAYGDTPVSLDVKVNEQTVFSNVVSTIAGDFPTEINAVVCDQVLFEVANSDLFPTTFSGSYSCSVTVSGGTGILIDRVMSNHMVTSVISEHATVFLDVYNGTPTNSDTTIDVRSNVYIDGSQQAPLCGASTSCWTWQVNNGSTLVCDLNISAGGVS